MVFQFSSPGAPDSTAPSSNASTPGSGSNDGTSIAGSVGPGMGMGSWVERLNHVHERSAVPLPKRRKTQDGEFEFTKDGTMHPIRAGSGVLGEYIKEKRKEANGTSRAMAVDLTGMYLVMIPLSYFQTV